MRRCLDGVPMGPTEWLARSCSTRLLHRPCPSPPRFLAAIRPERKSPKCHYFILLRQTLKRQASAGGVCNETVSWVPGNQTVHKKKKEITLTPPACDGHNGIDVVGAESGFRKRREISRYWFKASSSSPGFPGGAWTTITSRAHKPFVKSASSDEAPVVLWTGFPGPLHYWKMPAYVM